MLCPILPQKNPDDYARKAIKAIRGEKCEHIWAEPFNAHVQDSQSTTDSDQKAHTRDSFTATFQGLMDAGFQEEAERFNRETGNRVDWEAYCRNTFNAFAKALPVTNGATKLRWLQYVRTFQDLKTFWAAQKPQGALLLGAIVTLAGKKTAGATHNSSAVQRPTIATLPSLNDNQRRRSEAALKAWKTRRQKSAV